MAKAKWFFLSLAMTLGMYSGRSESPGILQGKNAVALRFLLWNGLCALGLTLFFSSCVPNRRVTYLQHEQERSSQQPVDTALRTYELRFEPYRLRANDIISLRVASVTEREFNFINKYESELGIIRKLNQYNTGGGNQQGGQTGFNRPMVGGGGNLDNSQAGVSSLTLDQLNTGFALDLNGKLNLPQVGEIQLSGLTIPEAELKVREAVHGYYETPMVRIQLLNFHFTVLGEVNNEGRYTSYDPDPTIFDAFSIAGNLSEFADRANIKIIRDDGGKKKVIYLNALDERMLSAENFFLQRGDLIIVPPLQARTANKYTVPNLSRTLGFVSAAMSLLALIISLNR